MHITHLQLADFRSYHEVDLELAPGVTALVGPNGQGKTNLVEAIGYAATLSSHRVPTDAALVRSGAERAVVRVRAVKGERAQLVEIEITPGKANRARVNRAPVPRPRDVLGIIRTVLFAPEDLALVKGDPEGRRRFLDDLLILRQPRLAGVRTDYERILRQRGALLKSAGAARRASRTSPDLSTLDIWDGHLARAGAEILQARLALIDSLRPYVAESYEQVSSAQGDAHICYKSSIAGFDVEAPGSREEIEEQLLQAMILLRSKEIERGASLVGPHRDDLELTLADLPAKGYASHGESWSFTLGLRLASYELLSHDAGPDRTVGPGSGEPVLILDDVFAELDCRRRDKLAELVSQAGQVIITAAVAQDVPAELDGVHIDVRDGRVSRVT